MTSDQELFAKGLATYQRVVAANYMAHEQVGNLLHEVLLNEAKDGFVFADPGCGTAPFSAVALAGTGVARYIGIDISKPSLDVARDALSSLTCPVEFRWKGGGGGSGIRQTGSGKGGGGGGREE